MAPLIGIIKGTFSDNFRSKLCLRQSISEFDVIKHNIVPLISPLVATATATYFEFRSKRYLKGMCPNGNMYGIGNYRRNFATFEDTVRWLRVFFIHFVLHQAVLFTVLQVLQCSPETNALCTNISDIWFTVIYQGICVPAKMKVPSYRERKDVSSFYVRPMQTFEPRGPVLDQDPSKQLTSNQVVWRRKAKHKTREKAKQLMAERPSSGFTIPFADPCPSSSLTAAVDVHHGEEKPQRGMYEGSCDYWQEKEEKIEEGQKLKFNTDPKVDNSNMCDNGNGDRRKKRKPLSRGSTIIVDLSMKKPSRTETFPHVEI